MPSEQYGYVLNWDVVDRNAPVRQIPAEHRSVYLTDYGLPVNYGEYGENFSGKIAVGGHGIYAVGETPEQAVWAFARERGWGDVEEMTDLPHSDEDAGREPWAQEYTWGRRFTAGGTGFKAAGKDVPGGVILTWWK